MRPMVSCRIFGLRRGVRRPSLNSPYLCLTLIATLVIGCHTAAWAQVDSSASEGSGGESSVTSTESTGSEESSSSSDDSSVEPTVAPTTEPTAEPTAEATTPPEYTATPEATTTPEATPTPEATTTADPSPTPNCSEGGSCKDGECCDQGQCVPTSCEVCPKEHQCQGNGETCCERTKTCMSESNCKCGNCLIDAGEDCKTCPNDAGCENPNCCSDSGQCIWLGNDGECNCQDRAIQLAPVVPQGCQVQN